MLFFCRPRLRRTVFVLLPFLFGTRGIFRPVNFRLQEIQRPASEPQVYVAESYDYVAEKYGYSSAHFSLNICSALDHTLLSFLLFNSSKLGSNCELKDSLASRGSIDGRWSIAMTLRGGSVSIATGTVGL